MLVFRDITYFPLTWRFAVEEFGWAYHFEEKTGLVITANDVIQENPEEWRVERDFFAGMMGCHEDFISISLMIWMMILISNQQKNKEII